MPDLNNLSRRIWRILLIILCIALASWLLRISVPLILDLNNDHIEEVSGIPMDDDFILFLEFTNIGEHESRFANIEIKGIDVPRFNWIPLKNYDPWRICVQSVQTITDPSSQESPDELPHITNMSRGMIPFEFPLISVSPNIFGTSTLNQSVKSEGICSSNDSPIYPAIPPIRLKYGMREIRNSVPMETTRSIYWYPFDKRVLDTNVLLNATVGKYHSLGIWEYRIAPVISTRVTTPTWDEKISFEQKEDNTNIKIEFLRPIGLRILSSVLLVSILIIIIFSFFISDTGSFLEVAVAIILGLWGVQNSIIPENITGTTLIDNCIMSLYALLAFIIFIRFFIKPAMQRLAQHPESNQLEENQELCLQVEPSYPLTTIPEIRQTPKRGPLILQIITAVSATITTILTAIIAILYFTRKKD